MKRRFALLIPLICGTAASCQPAYAYTIMGHSFADRYCQYRAVGVAEADAIKASIQATMLTSTDLWTMVTVNGQSVRSDYLDAILAVKRRCPEYAF